MAGLHEGYRLRRGSGLERAQLVKFLQRTYRELQPESDLGHLPRTVDQHLSSQTPIWWIDLETQSQPVACLWMGNAMSQITGDRQAYIFLLYVIPEHRRRGLGQALMRQAEQWACQRGDRQIGLQVFQSNQAALNLYQKLGYQSESVWMVKSF